MNDLEKLKFLAEKFDKMISREDEMCDNSCDKCKQGCAADLEPLNEEKSFKPYSLEEKDTFVKNDHNFMLHNYVLVNGELLEVAGNTTLTFVNDDEDALVPGITEKQLLKVLRYRYRRQPEKLELIAKLLS